MTFQDGLEQRYQATLLIKESNDLTVEAVTNAFLLTWQWWVALAMIILPWVIWFIVRDRKSSARLFSAGLLVMVLSEILDAVGVSYGKWAYPVKVIPVATVSFSFRLSVIPVLVMLFLQYKPHISPLIKAIVFAALGSYVGLPLLEMIDLYQNIDWALTNSFIILTIMYLLAHWVSRMDSFDKLNAQ